MSYYTIAILLNNLNYNFIVNNLWHIYKMCNDYSVVFIFLFVLLNPFNQFQFIKYKQITKLKVKKLWYYDVSRDKLIGIYNNDKNDYKDNN